MRGTSFGILLGLAAGCAPASSRDFVASTNRTIVGWRPVNRPYKDLENLRLASDARIPSQASALVFEPIYAEDETECDPDECVRLEVVSGEKAHVGELVTARISIPNADEDAYHVVEIRPITEGANVQGPSMLVLHGSEVKTIRFTSTLEGKAGVRISARAIARPESSKN